MGGCSAGWQAFIAETFVEVSCFSGVGSQHQRVKRRACRSFESPYQSPARSSPPKIR